MKKWFLAFCLLTLLACGTEKSENAAVSGHSGISEEKAKETALAVIKECWQAYGDIGEQASWEEKHERLIPFMTEEMFEQALKEAGKPAFPELPVYTFDVHVTENSPDSFTIEQIIAASKEDGTAVKQTTSFIKQNDRFILSGYQKEEKALSLSKEDVETFLIEHGYEAVFLKEGPFDTVSARIEDAYIFCDKDDQRIQFVVDKKTGFFLMGIVREATDREADTEKAAAIQEVREKYAGLFAYRLAEMDAEKLSAGQRDIYNSYIIQPIEQAIDIDFDPSLTDIERQHKTKELLDQSVAGMLTTIERTLNEKDFAALQKNHTKWAAERQKYAEEMAQAAKDPETDHFLAAYKEVTEDYLARLFFDYLY